MKFPVTLAIRALRAAQVGFEPHLFPFELHGGTPHSMHGDREVAGTRLDWVGQFKDFERAKERLKWVSRAQTCVKPSCSARPSDSDRS